MGKPKSGDPYGYDALLERRPPTITWRRKHNGVWVATEVRDPHTETTVEAQADRLRWSALAAMEEEAREVAARRERHRAANTRLTQAARSGL